MKQFKYFYLIIFIITNKLFAQPFGNEWINYNKFYYKIKISSEGIYRIDYNTLVSAGIPVNIIDPRLFQIFHNGIEQYIYVHGEEDGIFDNDDFIEFYAKGNDGSFDKKLYKNSEHQANDNYSLFNDTSAYFLTWSSSLNNKRVANYKNTEYLSYFPESHVYYTNRIDYTSYYYPGPVDASGLSDFDYTEAEGWFDGTMSINPSQPGVPQNYNKQIQTPLPYNAGGPSEIKIMITGQSSALDYPHHLKINFLSNNIDTTFIGYKNVFISRNFLSSSLSSNLNINFTLPNDLGAPSDRIALSYIEVSYPRLTNYNNSYSLKYRIKDNGQNVRYIHFTNVYGNNNDTLISYDLTNNNRIFSTKNNNNVDICIAMNGNDVEIYSTIESNVKKITQLTAINGTGKFTDYLSLGLIKADYLIITHPILINSANNYANYRSITGYSPLVINVEELYDQFAYGIGKHPLGIRNFLLFAITKAEVPIKGVFLIGKPYKAGEGNYNYRKKPDIYAQTLVPSIGNPPSDQLFLSGIVDTLYQPAIPIGRLAARNPNDVDVYLQKVIDFENEMKLPYNPNLPIDQEWRKKVLHFAGGSNQVEMHQFLSYLNQYKNKIENPYFGGNVWTFTKTSTDPIIQSLSDSIRNLVDRGVIMMNFFGHAAGLGFDISIDNPNTYNNYKRYPFVLANSCFVGDLFQVDATTSEQFVLIPNKGMIGFLGTNTASYTSYLHLFSNQLINHLSIESYGKSIGEIVKNTIRDIQVPNNFYNKVICYDFILHCDPVIRLSIDSLPDYMVTNQTIYTQPEIISNEIDSFKFCVTAHNLGKAIYDSVFVEIIRTYPDNTTETYIKRIRTPFFKDTIIFTIPTNPLISIGMNKFKIIIDSYNDILEKNENNNTTEYILWVNSYDAVPIYPYEFAVIPDTFVTLIASSSNPFPLMNKYIFEIDTTIYFNSPFKLQSPIIEQTGGIIQWTLPFTMLQMPDSIVYYWRVKTLTSSYWRNSSFQFIKNKRGWGQAHFFQFENNDFVYMTTHRPTRTFNYINTIVNIKAQTGYYPYIPWHEEWYKMNNVLKGQWSCTGDGGHGMKFAVFDTISITPWANTDPDNDGLGPYDALNCRNYIYYDFDFYTTDSIWWQRMTNFINAVPDGNYILAFSHRNHNAENYPEDLYQAFESFGSAMIRSLPNNRPYMIFGRKGYPIGTADEIIGTEISSIINHSWNLTTKWKEGSMSSPLIGPALQWNSIHWRVRSLEDGPITDTVRLFVLGIKENGTIDTLFANIRPISDSLDIYNLDQQIPANTYPYLKLLMKSSDDAMHTAPQPIRWQVLYTPVPETAILSFTKEYEFYKDTLQEGEIGKLKISTKNISSQDFQDSLWVKYWIKTNINEEINITLRKTRLHPANDVLTDSIKFSTIGLKGFNQLWVEFNPINPNTGDYFEIEQTHINNIASIPFYVNTDKINPLLDVTFDGIHILNGDIVSAEPHIKITVRDENKFLILDDTSAVTIFLKKPNASEYERIYFVKSNTYQLIFTPSSDANSNVCYIDWYAKFEVDGIYELQIQAHDRSGNPSGIIDYKIKFEIIQKPAITYLTNWPNPFSTKTHFVFTITGSHIPEYFTIQIMTISGKIVKEITREELGHIHIGRNITSYTWDGRDMYGNLLANGVYFYRVVTRLHGDPIEHIQTELDQYITKGFGKMVIIR
ncbi:MAG: C25 family cysteine peptidase [Bacteroidales bacterium]|jgi:hypothetical protein|nr:hypothetical protein [Bacteroidales bacterium]